jgi:molecular chaperone Hsp33
VGLGVLIDTDGSVKQAGGFIIQLMPFTTDEIIEKLEKRIGEIDSVTDMLERGLTPEQILEEILGELGLEITDTMPAEFYCDCSKEKVSRALATISKKDLDDIINDGESIEVKCQFCNSAYQFTVEELQKLR